MVKVKTFNDNIHNEASPICSAPSALTSWNMMLRERTFLSSLFVTQQMDAFVIIAWCQSHLYQALHICMGATLKTWWRKDWKAI